jgi:hypothetical protein
MSIHGTQIIGLFYHFPFQVPLCFPNSHYPLCAFLSLRMFDYEDVLISIVVETTEHGRGSRGWTRVELVMTRESKTMYCTGIGVIHNEAWQYNVLMNVPLVPVSCESTWYVQY